MKTNIILTICAVCLFSIMSATAQELTKKAIAFWKEKKELNVVGKFADVLIQRDVLQKVDSLESMELLEPLCRSDRDSLIPTLEATECLSGNLNGYFIVFYVGKRHEGYKERFFVLDVSLSRGGVTCYFKNDGKLLITYHDGNVRWWSRDPKDTQHEVDDMTNFVSVIADFDPERMYLYSYG